MKARSDVGLYDMHGNVWEWCRDAWSTDAYKLRIDGAHDPLVRAADVGKPEQDAVRVYRGGSWGDSAWDCRAACRFWWSPDNRVRFRGFRVCLFFGAASCEQSASEVTSEPLSVDVARRQAAAESDDTGGDVTEVDLSVAHLPTRSDGTKF